MTKAVGHINVVKRK